MDRKERLKAAYDHLRNCGIVHTQKAFAISLGKAEGTMSKAFKGDEKSLTDNLFMQIVSSYPNTFRLDWFLTGNGEMLEKVKELNLEDNFNSQNKNIIDTLAGVVKDVERELADIRIIRSELQKQRERIEQQELEREKKYAERMKQISELADRLNLFGGVGNISFASIDAAADENPRPK